MIAINLMGSNTKITDTNEIKKKIHIVTEQQADRHNSNHTDRERIYNI